jgi:hypothetical protein
MNFVTYEGIQDTLVALQVSLVTAQHRQFLRWQGQELDDTTAKNCSSPASNRAWDFHGFCILTAFLLMLDHSVRHSSHLDARKFVGI